ncbi:MAG TPA: protein kinase [Candidatus Saccharimonadales bacterium]|nr:protein kinase [Candidatus Saccharimonadales bacterium]
MSTIILSTEHPYCEYHSSSYTITNKTLGQGSYGKVYLATDNKQRKVAIKCCPIPSDGIDNLNECMIMKSIMHPYLNHAIDIFASKKMLYIIQPLAIMDLHQYTHMYKNNHQCTLDELKYIYHSLLQAVVVLHSQNIIHGDIKASNVLLYNDHTIKLTDFTLSVKMDKCFNHIIATATHRSLEVLLKKEFDLSADIWSLGITFYEIYYQELLIKNQHDENTNKQKYINAVLDWATLTNQITNITHYAIEYQKTNLSKQYYNQCNVDINKIMTSMLKIDPSDRPSAYELICDDFFSGLPKKNPVIITPIMNVFSHDEQARMIRYIEQCCDDEHVQNMAYKLYCQLTLTTMSESNKAVGVTWISAKLLNYNVSALKHNYDNITLLQIERDLCHDLEFQLMY